MIRIFVFARYELNMMTASQKTQFEEMFKEKKFYEIPNAIYRGWLGFKIAVLGTEENMFDKILAAKTITEIPRAKRRKVDGPTGAAKWDVTSPENLALFQSREHEKAEKEAKKKEAEEKRKEREGEKEAKKKEKEEQIQEKKRQREEKKAVVMAKKEAAKAKKAEKAAKKVEEAKETQEVEQAVPGPSNTRRQRAAKRAVEAKWPLDVDEAVPGPSNTRRNSRAK